MSEPKPYTVPEGHLIQLGADVLDGWEARRSSDASWLGAGYCRSSYPRRLMETRRVPERMVTVELPESVARWSAERSWMTDKATAISAACRKALEVDG